MLTFQNLSLRRKEMLIILLTCGAALLLTSAAFVAYDQITFRRELGNNISVLADAIGKNCTAAIDFNDPQSAAETLAALRANGHVVAACVYSLDGRVVAIYQRDGAAFVPPAVSPVARRDFTRDRLYQFRTIKQQGEKVGMILVVSDLNELSSRLIRYAGIVFAIFGVSLLLAGWISGWLAKVVSGPILNLTRVVRQVAQDKDYSVRASRLSGGEVGQLVDGFNQMLAQIQERDAKLEQRVAERTRELGESRHFLDQIINVVPNPIFVKNRQHRGVLVNDAFCQLTGLGREELLQKSDHDHASFTQAQADEFRAKDELVFATGKENVNEETITAADGTIHHLITKKALYTDEKGEKFIVGVIQDITERQRAESALRESEANYYSLVDQMPAGIFRKDKDGRYVFVNSWFCRFKGAKPEDFLGKLPSEVPIEIMCRPGVQTPESAGWVAGIFEDHKGILQNGRQIEAEERHHLPGDKIVCYQVIKSPVFGPDGAIVGSQGIMLDITQSKQAEAELFAERKLLRALIDHIPDYIYVRDLANRFVVANASFARLMGVTGPSALLGKRDADFYPTTTAADFDKIDQGVFAGNPHFNLERVILFPNGQELVTLNSKVPFKNDEGEVVGLIGVGRDITERKRMEAELSYERDLLRTLLDNSTDYIYFKDTQSRFIKSSNSQARQFGVMSADDMVGKTDFDFFSEEHARPAYDDEQEIIRTGRPMIGKVERETWRDGRKESWSLTTKMPFYDKTGKVMGTFGISKDITALKEAEAKLEMAHRQLMDASRQAGMAEVATSVLHNVGNVLNSVNVSTTLVLDLIKKSRVNNLDRLAAMIREQRDNLPAFFTADPKGKQLPDYLSKLAEHLAGEQSEMVKEIELTRKNIEHIKDIVMMQQSYARMSGVVDKAEVADLVEDALRMNAGALARHDVQVIRDYPEGSFEINVERHKVLQILVNLIRNAKYACDDSGRSDKRLTVQVRKDGQRAIITIADNGVGIPAENLTRIFNHGFTTRQNGHGFGLHSGALAAKEMGGELAAFSNGHNAGARFVLNLPVQPPSKL